MAPINLSEIVGQDFEYDVRTGLYLRRKPQTQQADEYHFSIMLLLQRSREAYETREFIAMMIKNVLEEQDANRASVNGLHRKVNDLLARPVHGDTARGDDIRDEFSRVNYRLGCIQALLREQRDRKPDVDSYRLLSHRVAAVDRKVDSLLEEAVEGRPVVPQNQSTGIPTCGCLFLVLFLLFFATASLLAQPSARIAGQFAQFGARVFETAQPVIAGDTFLDYFFKCLTNPVGCVKGASQADQPIVSTPDFRFVERNTFQDDGEFAPIIQTHVPAVPSIGSACWLAECSEFLHGETLYMVDDHTFYWTEYRNDLPVRHYVFVRFPDKNVVVDYYGSITGMTENYEISAQPGYYYQVTFVHLADDGRIEKIYVTFRPNR
jgi:hypothetical protein